MAEFFEVPIRREDGSESLQYVNVEAISYIDYQDSEKGNGTESMRIYLDNGYWFTVSGPKAKEVLRLVKTRGCISFNEPTGSD